MRIRVMAKLVSMLLSATAVIFGAGSAASAGPVVEAGTAAGAAVVGCYGGAATFTDTLDLARGPFFTTDRCVDINIKVTYARYQTDARACLERWVNNSLQTVSCSEWKLLEFHWISLSVGVFDNTRFRIQLRGNDGESVRYQVAY